MTLQTVYLIRHGEVNHNTKVLTLDRPVTIANFNDLVAHVPFEAINGRGVAQAHKIIPAVAELGLTCLYASPLLRAQQTARILAETIKVPVITRDDLYELLPAPLHGPPEREHSLKGAYIRSGLRLGNPFTKDTETAIQALQRMRRAWNEMTNDNRTNFGVVGHQGIFRLLFMWIHLTPNWKLVQGDTSNTGISIIQRQK